MVLLDVLSHFRVEPSTHHPSSLHGLANLCGTDIKQGRVDHPHSGGKCIFVYETSRTSVDEDSETTDNLFGMIPSGETLPVVGANHQRELMLGMSLLKFAQRGDGVGRQWETTLEIGHTNTGDVLGRQLRHHETVLVLGYVAHLAALQRIQGRDHQPQLIHQTLSHNGCRQLRMTPVNGIETPSVNAYSHKKCFFTCKGTGFFTYFPYLCIKFQRHKHERNRT